MLCLKNQRVRIGVESLSNSQLMVLAVMVGETSMRNIKYLILLKRLKQMLKKNSESTQSSNYESTDDDTESDNELYHPSMLKFKIKLIYLVYN